MKILLTNTENLLIINSSNASLNNIYVLPDGSIYIKNIGSYNGSNNLNASTLLDVINNKLLPAGNYATVQTGNTLGSISGKLIIKDGTSDNNQIASLDNGSNGQVLAMSNNSPAWSTITGGAGTDNGTIQLKVGNVSTGNIAVKGLGSAAYKNSETLISTIAPSSINLPTSKAVADFVETKIIGGMTYKGVVSKDASLPSSASTGWVYVANASFNHGTDHVEPGDWFLYNGSGWDIVNGENQVENNTTTYTLPVTAGNSSTFVIGTVDGTELNLTIQTPSSWKLTDSDEKLSISSSTSKFYITGITSTPNGTAVKGVANTNSFIEGGNKLIIPNTSVATSTVTGTATINNATITTATITNATVTNASITTATITNARISTATVTNASITTATVTNATINTATVTNATITTATITNARITTATVTNTNITTATISTINGVTVGSSPKFTDEKVTLNTNETNSEYAVIFRNATTATGNNTDFVKYNNNITINPSTKVVTNKGGAYRIANSGNTEGCNMVYNANTKSINFEF